ncbi:MAG TPA: M12 family metallo-peptidase [Thermoanaerobaculia bacterium]|nr:M12 family metallo-peptidase [Thermoanaerobaculia bacterium]
MKKSWMMMLALLLLAGAAHAANPLFSPVDVRGTFEMSMSLDASFQALVDHPATSSLQIVKANAAALGRDTESILLNLGQALDLQAHRVDSYVTKSGNVVWSGVIEDSGTARVPFRADSFQFDPLNQVVLVKNGKMITGNVHFNGEWYKIRPLKSGNHAIAAVNSKAMPPDHPAGAKPASIPMQGSDVTAAVNTVITVMVNYTPAVAAVVADVSGLIDLAVAETNTGYLQSGVTIDMVLANKALTNYNESGSFDIDLDRYRGTRDKYMKEIHTTRNTVAADVAVLLINNTQYCGLASGIGSTDATAFAAVYWDCATGYYSFAHEIGHLQSARHDPATDPTTTPYAYGHGYRYTGSPSWRTVMAYDCTGGCPRLNYWSNPNNLYNGVPMGTATQSDNARVLNLTRGTVAAFR